MENCKNYIPSMLSSIDWSLVSATAAREQVNRELHSPVVSVFRWWARRPHSVVGEILDAATGIYGERFLVSDPFSGGGTVAFEAVRRGLPIYAQDLYPWPAGGLSAALSDAQPDKFQAAARDLLTALDHHRSMYTSRGGGELAYVIRVRSVVCLNCQANFYLFPEPLISLSSRSPNEKYAFFGCRSCGAATKVQRASLSFECVGCGLTQPTNAPKPSSCPHCEAPINVKELTGQGYEWKPTLVGEILSHYDRKRAELRPVAPGDSVFQSPATATIPQLKEPVAPGIETRRLLDSGVSHWGDLYTERQAIVLLDALKVISNLKCSNAIKERLAYAVIGAAEMPAYLSRWDRFHLKTFEGLANHRYSSSTVVVEMNPLSPVGRGTLPRRFIAAQKALLWLKETCKDAPPVREVSGADRMRRTKSSRVVVATGGSDTQALPDRSVQIILTDPPYFNDVQYGELARLFHFWLSLYRPLSAFDEVNEASPNRTRGNTALSYQSTIAACLKESRRTLAKDGRLVMTFHNKKIAAWESLTGAIIDASFSVIALAVVHAENGGDHCKRNVNSMLHDLVVECMPRNRCNQPVVMAVKPQSNAEINLAAAGLAMAEAVSRKDQTAFSTLYRAELSKYKDSSAQIR